MGLEHQESDRRKAAIDRLFEGPEVWDIGGLYELTAATEKRASRTTWRARQRELNRWTDKYLDDITHLRVDGNPGHATRSRISRIKWYLGYGKNRDGKWTSPFVRRLRHPHSTKYSTDRMLHTGAVRRKHQRHVARVRVTGPGFGTFDGKTVARWMIPWLEKSRVHGWRGTVASGVRTPDYSEHLCYARCGRPSCPGTCAGRSSNHNMLPSQGEPHGALDVTYYQDFGRIQREIGSPLHNALGAQDPVHFSVSGR